MVICKLKHVKEENLKLKEENLKLKEENLKLKKEKLEQPSIKTCFNFLETSHNSFTTLEHLEKYFEYVKLIDDYNSISDFLRYYYRLHFVRPCIDVVEEPSRMYDDMTGPKVNSNIISDLRKIVYNFYEVSERKNFNKTQILNNLIEGIDKGSILVLSAPNNYLTHIASSNEMSIVSPSNVQGIDLYFSRDENILFGIGEGKNRLVEAFITKDSSYIKSKIELINIYELAIKSFSEEELSNPLFESELKTIEGVIMYEIFMINKCINCRTIRK